MKYYKSYLDRQEISPAVHEKLLNLEPPSKRPAPWLKYGALAACAALIIGVGVWRVTSSDYGSQTVQDALYPGIKDWYGPGEEEPDSANQFVTDYTPIPEQTDTVTLDSIFVVNSPAEERVYNFYAMPAIDFPDITGQPEAANSKVYMPGSFTVSLTKEDVQKLFWGPEGKPETAESDLPWALFWDGYTLHGQAWYDGEGQLLELTLWGDKGRGSFTLELRPGELPFTCCIDMDRGDTVSEAFGVEVAGWSRVYDRDGDDVTDYICGSEFMTENDIGVRFVSQNNGKTEDGADGEAWFNTLFVRQALISDGGLHLDHLMVNENIPAWREESFDTLAQARQEADFAPYLPKSDPEGYEEFFGHLTYQEDRENTLHVSWSRHYSSVIINIHREDTYAYNLVSPDEPELYDLRLYPVPWCYSVPEEYHETVDRPAFRAEDMSLDIVEARWNENDMSGRVYSFDVLHPDGTLVSYRCDGMTAQAVWAMVEETL